MIIAVGLTFPQVSWLYVGYPDNTFTGYVMKDTGGFGTFEYRNGTDLIDMDTTRIKLAL